MLFTNSKTEPAHALKKLPERNTIKGRDRKKQPNFIFKKFFLSRRDIFGSVGKGQTNLMLI